MRKLHIRELFADYWRPAAVYGAVLAVFATLLWWKLGSLVGGYSSAELASLQAGDNLRQIWQNPVNAPFNLVIYGMHYLGEQSLFLLRAVTATIGLLTLTVFYWLVRHWHGERAAIFGSVLFGCSAWFLHITRLGTPEVMLFGLLALAACAVWLKRTDSPLLLLLVFLFAATLVYVPGMIWLLALGVLWQWKVIDNLFKRHLWMVSLGGLFLLALLAPLAWAIYKTPETAKIIAGLPAQGWPAPLDVLQRLADVPINLFFSGPLQPDRWLGQLPILDAFCIVMLFLGGWLYFRNFRLIRAKIMATVLLVGTVLISLGGAVTLSMIIPFVYILVAAGIGFMLDRWYTVFPRNVIAQAVGVGLVTFAVGASCWFGLRHYYVAWPAVTATRAVFTVQQPPSSVTIKE